MKNEDVFDVILSLNLPQLEEEEPPMAFYAEQVENGSVEVRYNESGRLLVTQGTQIEDNWLNIMPRVTVAGVVKAIVILCGCISLFTLHRITFGTIPCVCVAAEPCMVYNTPWQRVLRYLFGMYGTPAPPPSP